MAHEYKATVSWKRDGSAFSDGKYSRAHDWSFDGGVTVPASSSPLSVRLPYSRADAVDPEEALRGRGVELPHADLPLRLRRRAATSSTAMPTMPSAS